MEVTQDISPTFTRDFGTDNTVRSPPRSVSRRPTRAPISPARRLVIRAPLLTTSAALIISHTNPAQAEAPIDALPHAQNPLRVQVPRSEIRDVGTHPVDTQPNVERHHNVLTMEGLSIVEIVKQLNLYSTKPIMIGDPNLIRSELAFGGTLDLHDVPAALAKMRKIAPIVVIEVENAYILMYDRARQDT